MRDPVHRLPTPHNDHAVTALLASWRDGDPTAPQQLLAVLYSDLRALAAHSLGAAARVGTLQPSDVVHEAYVKLLGSASRGWTDRRHFVAAAVAAMRSVIVDRARARACLKRGGGAAPVSAPLDTPATDLSPDELLAMHDAINRLETIDPRAASVLTLRCFGGLSPGETALVLDVSERVVRRDWEFAKRWLREALDDQPADRNQRHART